MKYGSHRNWRHVASNKTMRMPIKDGRPRVNAKPYRPNVCTAQLNGQVFGRPSTRATPCKRKLSVLISSFDSLLKALRWGATLVSLFKLFHSLAPQYENDF